MATALCLRKKTIAGTEDLEKYASIFEELSGLPVDMEYLKRAHVVVFVASESREWLAGYVMNTDPPYRVFGNHIPDGALLEPWADDLLKKRCIECTMIWMRKSHMTRLYEVQVFTAVALEAFASRSDIFIAGTFRRTMWLKEKDFGARLIYHGPGNGRHANREGWVYGWIGGRWTYLSLCLYFIGIAIRRIKSFCNLVEKASS